MALTKVTYTDGETVIHADNLNSIQDNILVNAEQIAVKVNKIDGYNLVADSKISSYDSHLINTSNPHSVTKNQIGLGNVDNTSDANKPISTATQAALDLKKNAADLATVATTGSYTDLTNLPTMIPVWNQITTDTSTISSGTIYFKCFGSFIMIQFINLKFVSAANFSIAAGTTGLPADHNYTIGYTSVPAMWANTSTAVRPVTVRVSSNSAAGGSRLDIHASEATIDYTYSGTYLYPCTTWCTSKVT